MKRLGKEITLIQSSLTSKQASGWMGGWMMILILMIRFDSKSELRLVFE